MHPDDLKAPEPSRPKIPGPLPNLAIEYWSAALDCWVPVLGRWYLDDARAYIAHERDMTDAAFRIVFHGANGTEVIQHD